MLSVAAAILAWGWVENRAEMRPHFTVSGVWNVTAFGSEQKPPCKHLPKLVSA